MITRNTHRPRISQLWNIHCQVQSHAQTSLACSKKSSSSSKSIASSLKQIVQQKCLSARNKLLLQKCSSEDQTVYSANKSLSREKILDIRIDVMLKQQQLKIHCLHQSGNKIKFGNSGVKQKLEPESSVLKNSKSKKSDYLCEQNKQNEINPNKEQNFQANSTQKSNKLSLRHYISSTPGDKNINFGNKNESKSNLSFLESKQSSHRSSTKVVLEEVRELKQMLVEFIQRDSQVKPHRKAANWSHQSKQLFTLP